MGIVWIRTETKKIQQISGYFAKLNSNFECHPRSMGQTDPTVGPAPLPAQFQWNNDAPPARLTPCHSQGVSEHG